MQFTIAQLIRILTRRGALIEVMGQAYLGKRESDNEEARKLRPLKAAAITHRIAFSFCAW